MQIGARGAVAGWLSELSAPENGRRVRPRFRHLFEMARETSAVAPLPAGPKAYFGEDTGRCTSSTYAMARALTIAIGSSPDFHFFRGHNHVSALHSLGSSEQGAGDEVLRVLEDVIARQPA